MPGRPRIPISLSMIKSAVYGGRKGFGPGVRMGGSYRITFEFRPSVEIIARDMYKLGLDIQSFRVPLERSIREVMIPSIRKNFQLEGRPEAWEPLALYTEQIRGSARPILYRTGALEKAATSFGIWKITKDSATVQRLPDNVWYGALHQEGYGSLAVRARQELTRLGFGTGPKSIQEYSNYLGKMAEGGGRVTKSAIPQRKFILMQDEDADEIQEIFIEWMEDQVQQAGRGWDRGPRY